jgi:hypothetical protein
MGWHGMAWDEMVWNEMVWDVMAWDGMERATPIIHYIIPRTALSIIITIIELKSSFDKKSP